MNCVLLSLVVIVFCGLLGVDGCGRRRRRCPPRDYTPPVITCPSNIDTIADPFQVNAKVTYTEPTALDNGKTVKVRRTRGLPSGYIFCEGTSWIRYTARDRSGNTASCQFSITVRVVRCPWFNRQTDGWKICHVSTDMRYGSYCRFGCYAGHELNGTSYTRCQSTGQWTVPNQPTCQKLTCDRLFPTPGQNNRVSITCSDDNNYRSICTYNCMHGYSVLPGHSKVRVCGATGHWVGTTPSCVDTSPPVFTNCPAVVTAYAEKSQPRGQAVWNDPSAIDNSDSVTVEQTSIWPQSGMELSVGQYDVTYTATDDNNNIATCSFIVVVKQIMCPTIYPLPYTSVTCLGGSIYGSTCEFTCHDGASTNRPLSTECKRHGNTYFYGLWDFGNNQPYCEQPDTCTDLRAPDNGALACDNWYAGRYCQMMCQEGFTVYDSVDAQIHTGLLVCTDGGDWIISDQIPNCEQEVRGRSGVDVSVSFAHYAGPCENAKEEIKSDFLISFMFLLPCIVEDDCHVDNVTVICGDSGIVKRNTLSTLDVKATVTQPQGLSFKDTVSTLQQLEDNLQAAVTNGSFGVTVGGVTVPATSATVSQPKAVCEEGTVPTPALKCVKCSAGSHKDNTTVPSKCRKCGIGMYQDEPGKPSCKQCPSGMTTEQTGATVCQVACQLGHYSEKGTTPCNPCDIGYYADVQGTRGQCLPCPGSKTTNKTGSTSSSVCYDVDIDLITLSENEEIELPSVLASTSASQDKLSFNMWLNCTRCGDILAITNHSDNTNFITIQGGDTITTTVGSVAETSDSVAFDRWHYVYVEWSPSSVQVYLNGQSVTTVYHASDSLPTVLNVTLGGPNFVGKISQFNMHSSYSASRRRRSTSAENTCFTNNVGDLVRWTNFTSLDGSFVTTRTKCDAYDDCLSSPCQNGGECSDAIDGFKCRCLDGFTGDDCSVNIDDCVDSTSCDNGGSCVDGDDDFTCNCPAGFSGALCEIKVVDGGWGSYGNWTVCSVTCGIGQQVRNRTCDTPEPSNTGAECVGASFEIKECTMEPCIYECDKDLKPIPHCDLGCDDWVNETVTRRCHPKCDDGYDFDSDLNVVPTANVYCGSESGNEWNVHSNQLPTCQLKTSASTNILDLTATYTDLSPTDANHPVLTDIKNMVHENAMGTTCALNGQCFVVSTVVQLTGASSRRRRSTPYVTFTVQVTCDITTDMNQCYDILSTFVNEFNDLINANAFTVTFDGGSYDVTANSTSLDGTSVCRDGYVPVEHYCVACGPGMYQGGEFCIQCPVGYYQDQSAQLTCEQCPEGWTTADVQSRDASFCNVANMSDSTDETFNYAILAAALSVAVVVVVVIAGVFIKKKKSKPKRASSQIHVSEAESRADSNANRHFNTPATLFTVSPPPSFSPTRNQAIAQSHGRASALPNKEALEDIELYASDIPTKETGQFFTRNLAFDGPYRHASPLPGFDDFVETRGQASPLPRK